MTKIIPIDITDEMKSAYLDYAMSVIVSRALPDVRDGLKPVHRRILYSAYQLNLLHNQPYKKSARLVGEVLGKYHPHGDAAIYDAIVRMAQPFSMRYVLIDGQGNFGSIDGDSAAAMRYTEVRLTKLAEEMLQDIDKDAIDFMPNFDNTLKEPIVLPAKVPNLLINGTSGIAVGMATNIPPHNLKEVVDAVVYYIKNPEADVKDLMQFIKAPDFPTGAVIEGTEGIIKAYTTGKGRIVIRSKYHFEQKGSKEIIVIDEIPYQTNKSEIIKEIAELAKRGLIDINDLRDESDRKHGIRIVIELKRSSDRDLILKRIFAHTKLKITYNIILLALVNGQPRLLNLKDMIHYFVEHRVEVIKRRTLFLLKKAQDRLHIINGLLIAISDIDKTVNILKQAKDVQEAKNALMSSFNIDEIQAKAILDMKLQRIIGLEREKLEREKSELEEKIKEYNEILSSREKINEIIINELQDLKEKYGDDRKTEITHAAQDISEEDLIKDEEVVIIINDKGFAKRIPIAKLKVSSRKDRSKERLNEGIKLILTASTKQNLFLVSNKGNAYVMKAWKIKEESKTAKGKHLNNIIKLKTEFITSGFAMPKNLADNLYVMFVTKKGFVKKTALKEFANVVSSGIRAINLDKDDEVVSCFITYGKSDVFIYTEHGMIIRFDENDVRPMGRSARGVRGIHLNENDQVIGAFCVENATINPDLGIFAIGRNGKGKITKIDEYSRIGRGGKGIISIKAKDVAYCCAVMPEDEVVLLSNKGYLRRLAVREIPIQGRNTTGVYLFRLKEDDFVKTGAKIKLS